MSHISTYAQKVVDLESFKKVCEAKGYDLVENPQEVAQFARNTINGAAFGLKIGNWKYDIAVMPNGEIKYDNWGAQPGSMEDLGLLLQDYNEEAIMSASAMEVDYASVEVLPNGDKKLVLEFA